MFDLRAAVLKQFGDAGDVDRFAPVAVVVSVLVLDPVVFEVLLVVETLTDLDDIFGIEWFLRDRKTPNTTLGATCGRGHES